MNEPKAPGIPMLLWCPECSGRHIDEGSFATRSHTTHACQHCGHVWRPAIVPTTGVRFLPGFKNEAPSQSASDRIVKDMHDPEKRWARVREAHRTLQRAALVLAGRRCVAKNPVEDFDCRLCPSCLAREALRIAGPGPVGP